MFGIPIDGPSNVFCDNEVVYKNSTFVELQLKRKYNLICYHLIHKALASGKMVFFKIEGKENMAD